ncbi:LLM class flavin-dependent oxidoreductase [Streptomyces zagrosensis]|uniref:Alkanesulfonate monooxygenase SsuD/methylene tetrahydromethanopterin reductase-like flavin-dependent oxidoreductase (Luciferase family) n=1 Tax=Streptomyces zagrosensis TaxID=1042984 RepID=A0A7W9UXV1_9ACTN|nr:LLM class flavin-dependent oxidoreductase [Streptomyces zagrosensis]MBB5935265.1 alkanesulfonate monooxygenase SsuD/methylene tetrahydromethanopterin reductase-like flavin-dependent oxidoreductase (luciferase family) [Streptomyces zagrosensis]
MSTTLPVRVGIGLPISDPGTLLTWAKRADAGPFATLGLLDRLVYDNPEPLITLAAIAGATSRIRVQTEVLLAPLREPVLLAKQAATLDRISHGRFTLGLGIGGREDDFLAVGGDVRHRGRALEERLAVLRRVWAGGDGVEGVPDTGPVGPAPISARGPEILFGGFAPAALARVGQWGDGFLGASLPPAQLTGLFRTVEEGWQRAGREGRPRLVAQVNVAIGPDPVVDEARRAIRDYYAFSDFAEHVARGLLGTADAIRAAIAGYAEIGADEVMLYCWSADPDQVDRLAEIIR